MSDAVRDARPWLQIVQVGDIAESDAALDVTAPPRFTAFLERVVLRDANWRRLPTWLVLCGHDGGRESIASAWRRRWAGMVSPSGYLPCDDDTLAWPSFPLRDRTPNGRVELQLFAMPNTVDDESRSKLARVVDAFTPEPPRVPLRFIATAAPVSPGEIGMRMRLAAGSMASATPDTLVAGPLASRNAQSCNVLRWYWSPSRARTVVLERWTAVRSNRLGSYGFAPHPDTGQLTDEWVLEG